MASEEAITEGVTAQDAVQETIGDFLLERLTIHVVTLDTQTLKGSSWETRRHTADGN